VHNVYYTCIQAYIYTPLLTLYTTVTTHNWLLSPVVVDCIRKWCSFLLNQRGNVYTHILYNTHTCCYNQKSHIDKHSFRLHIVAIIIIMCVRVQRYNIQNIVMPTTPPSRFIQRFVQSQRLRKRRKRYTWYRKLGERNKDYLGCFRSVGCARHYTKAPHISPFNLRELTKVIILINIFYLFFMHSAFILRHIYYYYYDGCCVSV